MTKSLTNKQFSKAITGALGAVLNQAGNRMTVNIKSGGLSITSHYASMEEIQHDVKRLQERTGEKATCTIIK